MITKDMHRLENRFLAIIPGNLPEEMRDGDIKRNGPRRKAQGKGQLESEVGDQKSEPQQEGLRIPFQYTRSTLPKTAQG
jgi:hypothetical protein